MQRLNPIMCYRLGAFLLLLLHSSAAYRDEKRTHYMCPFDRSNLYTDFFLFIIHNSLICFFFVSVIDLFDANQITEAFLLRKYKNSEMSQAAYSYYSRTYHYEDMAGVWFHTRFASNNDSSAPSTIGSVL